MPKPHARWPKPPLQTWPACSTPGCACPIASGSRGASGSFPPSRVFWLFLNQVLSPDQGCAEVLKSFLCWLALDQRRSASPNTGAYCRARIRPKLSSIEQIQEQVALRIARSPQAQPLWCGRHVKVVDGSSVSMPDTKANQALYPQPKGQKPGCGFPVMRIVAVFSLASGALIEVAKGALHAGERALFRSLWDTFERAEVILADTGFCGYAEFCLLRRRGVDCVMRNHQCRSKGITTLKRLSGADRIIQWHKTKVCPAWLTRAQWKDFPERLTVREIAFNVQAPGFRTKTVILATTLLDPKQFPASALAELYLLRWKAELYLRDIKTTLHMDVLRCKTPDMVHKELAMHLIAYNLVRALMLTAANQHRLCPMQLSFKGACATVRHFANALATPALRPRRRAALEKILLWTIAYDRLPHRPDRTEPRARKRRPKNYQLLTQPRNQFKETPHRNRYKKP